MSNEELVREYQSCKAPDQKKKLLTELYNNNTGLIKKMARYYSGCRNKFEQASTPEEILYEDLSQVAFFGLLTAAERWDSTQEGKFISYAAIWMKNAMHGYMSNNLRVIRLPVHLQEKLYKLLKLNVSYQLLYGKAPSMAAICEELNVTASEAERLKAIIPTINVASLDEPLEDEPDISLGGSVADNRDYSDEVIEAADNEALAMKLWSVVDGLKGKRPTVLHEYFEDGKNLREIASDMGCSHQAIDNNLKNGLADLRKKSSIQGLRHYIDADAYSLGIKDTGYAPFIHKGVSSTEYAAMKLASL